MSEKKNKTGLILIIAGVTVAIAIGIFVVLKFYVFTQNCGDVKFTVSNMTVRAGKAVIFTDASIGSHSWDWDFGDSTAHGSDFTVTHTYLKEGDYQVTPEIGELIDTLPSASIQGPDTVALGSVAKFTDASSIATSWSWSFGETGSTDATTKEASYTFKIPGSHSISLAINGGNSHTTYKKVFVLPRRAAVVSSSSTNAPQKLAPQIKIDPISEEEFRIKLLSIAHRSASGAGIFEKYVSYLNMPITVNGQDQQFDSYCRNLRISGVGDITKVSLTKDENGLITAISITQTAKKED